MRNKDSMGILQREYPAYLDLLQHQPVPQSLSLKSAIPDNDPPIQAPPSRAYHIPSPRVDFLLLLVARS